MNTILYPQAFILIILPFLIWYILPVVKGLHGDALKVPFIKDIEKISIKSGGLWSFSKPSDNFNINWAWLYIAYVLLVLAIARPQFVGEPIRVKNEGRDIVLVMDISNSMLERDFNIGNKIVDRLTAVKNVASGFISKRTQDRLGLVLFATRAYMQVPITYDKASLTEVLWQMDAGMAGESTSIGDAVGIALKNLKSDDAKEKVIILLTDGENNDGSLDLPQVIKLAEKENVKIYTIGVGSDSSIFSSFMGIKIGGRSPLDEADLQKLSATTKGNYYRASDTSSLYQIYQEIDRLEPNKVEQNYVKQVKELYYIPLLLSLLLVVMLMLKMRIRQ